MRKFKHSIVRRLMFFSCIGIIASFSHCTSDDEGKELEVKNFLEIYDGTTWNVTNDEQMIYLRINNNMAKAIELWISEIELNKSITTDRCFHYNDDLLEIEEMQILENSANKLSFTYLGNETWTFSIQENRLKIDYTSMSGPKETIYLERTNGKVDDFEICTEDFSFVLKYE